MGESRARYKMNPLDCRCGACNAIMTLCEVVKDGGDLKVIMACNNVYCNVAFVHYYLEQEDSYGS